MMPVAMGEITEWWRNSYVGGMLTGGVKYLVTGLLCIFSLGILGTIFKQLYNDRQVKKAGNTHE